jgi:hypothetical protein
MPADRGRFPADERRGGDAELVKGATASRAASRVWEAMSARVTGAVDRVFLGALGAVDLAARCWRRSSPPAPCADRQAVEDFPALLHGELDTHGLARFSRHTATCLACRELLTTVVLAVGIGRVVRAGARGLVRTRPQGQAPGQA